MLFDVSRAEHILILGGLKINRENGRPVVYHRAWLPEAALPWGVVMPWLITRCFRPGILIWYIRLDEII